MSELDPILDSLFNSPFAPAPSVRQLELRRVQLHRRRSNARIAGAVCAVVAVIALTRSVNSDPHEVHTIDDGGRITTTLPDHPGPLQPGLPADLGTQPGVELGDPGAAPGGVPGFGPTTTTGAMPAGEGCTVESAYDQGVETPIGGAGYGTNGCEYTATVASGYVAHGFWRIVIERDGHAVALYDNGYYPHDPSQSSGPPPSPCGEIGTVQPGDHVLLYLRYGAETIADPTYVRAGPDHHC